MPDDNHTILEGATPEGVSRSAGAPRDGSTIIEGASADSSTIIEGTQARAEAGFNLVPGGVFEGYTLLRPLEVTSGEADLWFIADAQGVEYVLKLYRYGIKPKKEIAEKIRALGHQHSVRVIADGATSGRSFEILEKIEHGDLTRFITGQPLPDEWLREVLKELGIAVAHLHQIGILHRDIKPANIMVRSVEPLDLVLTDFGISSLSDGSLHMTTVNRTATYCAPEAMQGVVAGASDWWSVGVIILEMLKGRHPFAGMDERAVNFQLVAKGIQVPDDIPEDWQLLLKGLLTRDPDHRWEWDQLAGWLEGRRDMPLSYQEAQSAQAHGHKPYKINEKECFTAAELAAELGQDWEAGKANLGRGMITSWVEGQLSDQGLAVNLHEINENESWDSDDKLTAALMAMAPELPPFFKGEVVSLEWLANNPARAVEVCESHLPQLQARYRPKGEPNLTGISERVKQVLKEKNKDESGRRLAGSTRDLVISMAVDPAYPIKLGDEPISTMEWMAANPKRAVQILEGLLPVWQARLTDETSLNDALEGLKGWRNAIEQTGVEVDPGKVNELVLNYYVEGGPEELERRYIELIDKFSQGIYAGSNDEKLQAIIDGGEIGPVQQMVMLAVDESLYLTPQNKYLQDYALPMDWHLADQLIKANSWETLTPLWTEAVESPESVNLLRQPEYQRCYQTLHSQSPEYLDVVAMLAVLSELKQLAGWQGPAVSETAVEDSMLDPQTDLKFACPDCRTELTMDAAMVGQWFECPSCSAEITVPAGNFPEHHKDGFSPPTQDHSTSKKKSKGVIMAAVALLVFAGGLWFIFGGGNTGPLAPLINDYGRYQSATSTPGNAIHLQNTKRIPCRIGEGFGFRGELETPNLDNSCQLVLKVDHPPIKQPDGTTITSTLVNEQTVPPGTSGVSVDLMWFFQKGYEYELVPGRWVFRIIFDGQQMHEMAFELYDDATAAKGPNPQVPTINVPATLRQGLVAYYPFNGNAKDESGSGHHGRVNGATLTTDRTSLPGKAYSFDGGNDYINVLAHPDLGPGKITISLWALPQSTKKQWILYKSELMKTGFVTKEQYCMGSASGGITGTGFLVKRGSKGGGGAGWQRAISGMQIPLSKWHHFVGTWDGAQLKFYVDGRLHKQVSASPGDIDNIAGGDLRFGCGWQSPHSENFFGKLDDIRIYNRALTAQEITALYRLNN